MPDDTIKQAARREMKRRGMSTYRLSQLTGHSQQALRGLGPGRGAVTSRIMADVLDALGLTIVRRNVSNDRSPAE